MGTIIFNNIDETKLATIFGGMVTYFQIGDIVSRLLFSKEKLKKIIFEKHILAEISGVLSNCDFVNQIIKYKYIIYQNDLLNGKIPMDADNYYVHVAELESIELI